MKENKLTIKGIETNSGVFVQISASYSCPNKSSLYFDGELGVLCDYKDWIKIKTVPTKVEMKRNGGNTNYRYIIKDKSFINEKAKEVFLRSEVADYDKDNYEWVWKNEYSALESLYSLTSDKEDDYFEEYPFEYITLAHIDNIPDLTTFQYSAQIGRWRHSGMGTISNKNIKQQELDKIIFPEPLLALRPSKLSSEDSYKIIREYVKTNIDPEYAAITSDYNFCFTVKKKIHLDTPENYEVDLNSNIFSKRKRKPKMETRFRKTREVVIFEMTHSGKNYQGYTPIKGFEGKSHEDLASNIELYLTKLITEINKPLEDCPHCKGLGVLEVKKIQTNK